MRISYVFGFISIASAAVIPFEGLRQQNSTTDLIAEPNQNLDTTILNDEGYKYKSVRRLKFRQRRDITDSANEYLPPVKVFSTEANGEDQLHDETEGSADSAVLGKNGYEYKTVRRLKYRQRRDVSEIANEYLPPSEESTTEGVAEVKSAEGSEDSAVLGENGYEYKTVRRLKHRQRRDVSEIANEYLPPAEESTTEVEYLPPAKEYVLEVDAEVKSAEEPEDTAVLGKNGYEYKTVRRLKYRQRRDVSEIANEYLPPAEESTTEVVAEDIEHLPSAKESVLEVVAEVKSAEEPEDTALLGENGYEYKTVRRLEYRQRRDVSEIANEYLPPAEESLTEVVAEVKSAEDPEDTSVLGENGYEYKTVRRLKYRKRRDISEIANEYLPPTEEASTEGVAEVKSAEESEDSAVLGENGYEYKTVRRLKYRQRRDVSEIANEYLKPAEESTTEVVAEVNSAEDPEDTSVLGENGYEYKTVRRLKYRQRRDVSEIANEYLPPSEESTTETVVVVKSDEEPEDSAILGKNGYEYKTVRRLKYRQRRDVSEIANEYLPPAEESATEVVAEDIEYLPPAKKSVSEVVAQVKSAEEPEDSAVLGENGYEYKTVRRLKYRQRRDVSKIANEYLPPLEETSTQDVGEVKFAEEPEKSVVLGENGYEYKTVRRLKYRQRRDVSEIASEYLPPSEEGSTEVVAEVKSAEEPEDSAVVGENGYEYKTVRRLKYRQRREVSEIANEYLPPSEESTTEVAAEAKSAEEPENSAVVGENGYEYKTIRRLKYRQRRDVSEISNEYLPSSEETSTEAVSEAKSDENSTETVVETKSAEELQDSDILGEKGYEYKTVRRLKYRQ